MTYDLKITQKITVLIVLLSCLAAALAFMGYRSLNIYQDYSRQIQANAERASYSEKMNGLVYAVVMDSRGVYMARDAGEVAKFSKPLLENLEQIKILTEQWEKVVRPQYAADFAQLKQHITDFIAFRTEVVNRGRNIGAEAARLYGDNDENRSNRQRLNQKLMEVAELNANDIKTTDAEANAYYVGVVKLIVILSVLGIAACVMASLYIMRRFIAAPLSRLSGYMGKLARGDLEDQVPYQSRRDEVGEMAQSVSVLREGLLHERELAQQAEKQKEIDAEYRGQIQAIRKSQAVIEFNMDGTIITANDHFLNTMGYSLEEIQGRHHSMFAPPGYADTLEYRQFWEKLRRGEYDTGEYKRIGKNGKEVWIQASYNPIMTSKGVPFKIVKFATDVSDLKLKNADFEGQINAINKSQAVIHFNMDGTIIKANDGFLNFMGYSLEEIQGRHHKMFVEKEDAASKEYQDFWEHLRAGNFDSRVFRRVTKAGRHVWIQASYNPIFDLNGKPFKVVKYASDVTDMINLTDQTGANVQSVAAATEELSASIQEISSNMTLSKRSTDEIVERTQVSEAASERLVQTTKQMEKIVNLIRDIAEQVNLLALNATIEAARAGDAGKGFAVVASEVKNLANQTGQATDDIAREISEVQSISADVAQAIKNIITSADYVSQYVTGVAGAIEEQSIIVKEISANSQKTSDAVILISENIKKKKT